MRAETIFGLIFLVFAIAFVGFSFEYNMEARVAPLLIGIAAAILLSAQLLRENFGKDRSQKKEASSIATQFRTALPYLEFGGWMAGLLIAVHLIGIAIALSLVVFGYLKRQGEGWGLSILLTIGTFALIYGVFGKLLRVYLYKGLFLG